MCVYLFLGQCLTILCVYINLYVCVRIHVVCDVDIFLGIRVIICVYVY